MKITFVLPYAGLAGGIRVVAIYAQLLQKRGHKIHVVSIPKSSLRLRKKIKFLFQGKFEAIYPARKDSHFDSVDVENHVLEKIRPVNDSDVPDADVVVATWWETAEWVNNLSPCKGAKAYFIQHYEVHDKNFEERVKKTWSFPMHKITISQWLVDLAKKKYGDENVSLVFNSVDMEQFHATSRNKQAVPTVGLLYSTKHFKGCDISLRAIQLAMEEIPNLRVVSFGTEKESPKLPLPETAEYFYLPSQGSIKDIYAKCDVWLCGSRSEGFHLPPLEAMACRCPVVSTAVGGPLDIIKDGHNGYLAPVEDSEKLANLLIKVLQLPNQAWKDFSNKALKTAMRYSWEDATTDFESALTRAISFANQNQAESHSILSERPLL